jgi:N6-L-threonylcarbamoyladenine synthase
MLFFVVDSRNKVLYPSVKSTWADKMVKQGKAKWIRKRVIILKLNYAVDAAPNDKVSYFTVGLDTGTANIGYAVYKITNTEVMLILKGTGLLRSLDLKELLETRSRYRRKRRYNRRKNCKQKGMKLKFRSPRFSNRHKGKRKRYTPTARHLLNSHFRTLDLIFTLVPKYATTLNLEYAKFDLPALTGNRNKAGEGVASFTNARYYALFRDNHQCQFCKTKTGMMEVHHKHQRKDGGTDKPSNLITLCTKCHKKHHDGKIDANGLVGDEKNGMRATTLNIVMPEIYKQLAEEMPVNIFYGYETFDYRAKYGIDKTHANDAACLGIMHLNREDLQIIDFNIVMDLKQFRRHRRARVQRHEDRKYYLLGDVEKVFVAWNRNRRTDQDPKKPSLIEYKREHPKAQLSASVGKQVKFKGKYGESKVTPGTVVRDITTNKIHVVQSSSDTQHKFTDVNNVKVKYKNMQIIKQFAGMVIL